MAGFSLVLYPTISSLYSQPGQYSQSLGLTEPSAQSVSAETFSFNAAWDSKYVSEGRDNLEDGGLASIAIDGSAALQGGGEWFFAGWYAESIETPYTELNLGLGYGFLVDELDVAVGYTWLDFRSPDPSDHEFDLQLGFGLFDTVDFSTAFIYSTEASGTFIELVAATDIAKEGYVLTPYILLGINQGYIPGEHSGINNLQFGLKATTALSETMEAAFYLASSTGLEDIFWTGVSISFGKSPFAASPRW